MKDKYDALVSALDAIAFSRESDPVKLKTMAREALKGFNSGPTPRAADLPTDCPNGHGPLFPQDNLLFCDVCKFTVSR